MVVVYACIAPHEAETIPQLAGGKIRAFNKTRHGMEMLAADVRDCKIDTLVMFSAHRRVRFTFAKVCPST